MDIVWKDIIGFEGKYQISNHGQILSLWRYVGGSKQINNTPKIIKGSQDKDGYNCIVLNKDKPKGYKVHRLVAQAFIPNPLNLPQVNHKDGNKSNNCVDNLEWCDNTYNCWHKIHVLGYKHKISEDTKKNISNALRNSPKQRKQCKAVICIETGQEYYSALEASRQLNLDASCISKCCRGERKTVKGTHWKFKNE